MTPNGNDFLYGKFSHDREAGEIQLLRRGDVLIARDKTSLVIYQKWTDESVAFARDLLGLLGWKERACLRNFLEGADDVDLSK